jgi:hypothetical protein
LFLWRERQTVINGKALVPSLKTSNIFNNRAHPS